MLANSVAVCVVGFPATSLTSLRARLCISSSHTKKDLDHVLDSLDKIGSELGLKYNKSILGI